MSWAIALDKFFLTERLFVIHDVNTEACANWRYFVLQLGGLLSLH